MSKRFKLVFLSESEDYLTDVGCCSIDVRRTNVECAEQIKNIPTLEKILRSGDYKGRLRIASLNLYLDLDSIDDFVRVPFSGVSDIVSIGSDSLRVRFNQICFIPSTVIQGRTRIMKQQLSASMDCEMTIVVHATHLPEVLEMVQSLFRLRLDKRELKKYVETTLSKSVVPFDLTSLSSHRESLLLQQALKVVRIKKMVEVKGLLQISRNYVYFQAIPSFGSKKVKRFPLLSANSDPAVISNKLKYKLKSTGVEFLFSNGKNLFILFDSIADRDALLNVLESQPSKSSSVSLPPLKDVTDMWVRSDISTFSYLMFLNFISGRSVNDLGQYPIFPWTVSDMTSSSIDLNNPSSFRDLSVPIAATNPTKLSQYKERAMHIPEQDRFLFGSFYSNPAFVLYFLIRKFPECHLRLHGGHFDHSARLFTSLKTAWEAVSETGSATMELIPEFYSKWESAVEWLANSPSMTMIPELAIPPWAESPKDFVVLLRCALESKQVSSQINLWIDLVFGVKSRGRQICLDSNNLFHPICYLTDVDGDVMSYCKQHETSPDVVTLQSQEFGHVPRQIFSDHLHPKRDLSRVKKQWSERSFYTGPELDWRTEILRAYRPKNTDSDAIKEPMKLTPTPITVKNLSSSQVVLTRQISSVLKEGDIVDYIKEPHVSITDRGYMVTPGGRFRLSRNGLACMKKSDNCIYVGDARDGTIYMTSIMDGLLRSRQIHNSGTNCIDLMPRGISAGMDHSIAVWDPNTLEVIYVIDFHSAPVTAIRSVGDSFRFISGDAKGVVALWDSRISTESPVWQSIATGAGIVSIDCSRCDRALVTDKGGCMYVWDISGKGSILWKLAQKEVGILSAKFSCHDPSLIIAVTSKSIHLYKLGITPNGVSQLSLISESPLEKKVSRVVTNGVLDEGNNVVVVETVSK